jgi:hypothetical protein
MPEPRQKPQAPADDIRSNLETLDAIYAYADRHEITLAETIERAVSALAEGEG